MGKQGDTPMPSTFALHRFKLAGLLIAANAGLLLHLLAGEGKPVAAWNWLDIAGEGGSAVLLLIWIGLDRKSTRLNSSHVKISYAVFCSDKSSKQSLYEYFE